MGFSQELFVDGSGLDDLTCAICHEVFDEPYTIGCSSQHAFCHECLRKFFDLSSSMSCPSCRERVSEYRTRPAPFIKRLVDKRAVRCSAGCGWKGPIGAKHGERCDLRLTACLNEGCEWTGPFNDSASHDDECAYTLILCEREDCGVTIPRREIEKHDSLCRAYRCSFYAIDLCPFLGDAASLKLHTPYCEGIHAQLAELDSGVDKEHSSSRAQQAKIKSLEVKVFALEAILRGKDAVNEPSSAPPSSVVREFELDDSTPPWLTSVGCLSPHPDTEYDEEEEGDEHSPDGDEVAALNEADDNEPAIDHDDDDGEFDEPLVTTLPARDEEDEELEDDCSYVEFSRHYEFNERKFSSLSATPQPESLSPAQPAQSTSSPTVQRPASAFPLTAHKSRNSSTSIKSAAGHWSDGSAKNSGVVVAAGPFKLTQQSKSHTEITLPLVPPGPFDLTRSSKPTALVRKPSEHALGSVKRARLSQAAATTESSDTDTDADSRTPLRWEKSGRIMPSFGGGFPGDWSSDEDSA